jgi:hypothetical protein
MDNYIMSPHFKKRRVKNVVKGLIMLEVQSQENLQKNRPILLRKFHK